MSAAAGTTLPLADAPALWVWARRTAILRTALALVIAAMFGLCLAAAFTLRTRATSYFATGSGVVVADMSKSIDPRAYQRMGRVLDALSTSGQRLGLVAFSDYPYELLPPGTRGDELRPLLRFFRPTSGGSLAAIGQVTPWSNAFFGGTDIGRGLALARRVIEQDRFRSRSVLLISDLQDSAEDLPVLIDEIARYRREGITLRVVPLFPPAGVLPYFESVAGHVALSRNELLHNTRVTEHRSVVGTVPWWLLVCGGALLALVAVNERVCRRMQWSAS